MQEAGVNGIVSYLQVLSICHDRGSLLRCHDLAGFLLERASASTSGAPAATSEAILPSASTSTAIGVPWIPNLGPIVNPSSSKTGERSTSAWFASTPPVETTSSFGAPCGGSASHAFKSASICWQKPQPGFQKSTSVLLLRKSERLTVLPFRFGRVKAGAGSPTCALASWPGAAAAEEPLPLGTAAIGSA